MRTIIQNTRNIRSIATLAMLIGLLGFTGCKSSGDAASREQKVEELVAADVTRSKLTPNWAPTEAEENPYRPSETRHWDLLHTDLSVHFLWDKQRMNGKAKVDLTPLFYTQDSLHLDAKGMLIGSVELHRKDAAVTKLNYTYDGLKLHIQMDRPYRKGDTAQIAIDYQARPNEAPVGGSAAISADKGLYFINPNKAHPYKPRQIWTQGETEASSRWFPTIDQPNERTTQRLAITVDDNFVTLSNGLMTSTNDNGDGTRTDVWQMDKPHAPYLFMMAVGEFARVQDEWKGIPVDYYLEPQYAPYAKLIFGNTPEMIQLFSDKFGVTFPWPKYSQVVVRDFVSGAMENTTATIHMEQLQHDARSHLDETYEDYVSHELAHQWFGDLVTCESWANIAMNESFATYLEVLWREHKYGYNSMDYHRYDQLKGYLQEAAGKREPLIRFNWPSQEAVFDRHSYNKGGTILHLLRETVGEDAFFASLQYYLKQKQYQAVESHDLRLAFEHVTGQDLNWFWNQWFFSAGHPTLKLRYTVQNDTIQYHIAQVQNLTYQPLYRLPVELSYVASGKAFTARHWLSSQDTTFAIVTGQDSAQIQLVEVDPLHHIPLQRDEEKPLPYWTNQLLKPRVLGNPQARAYHSQRLASGYLANNQLPESYLDALTFTLRNARFWEHRQRAISQLARLDSLEQKTAVVDLFFDVAKTDTNAAVRAAALDYLSGLDPVSAADTTKYVTLFSQVTAADSSYAVVAAALNGLYLLDAQKGLSAAREMTAWLNPEIGYQVGDILMLENDPKAPQYLYEQILKLPSGFLKLLLMDRAADYALHANARSRDLAQKKITEALMIQAKHGQPWYERMGALRALGNMEDDVNGITEALDALEPAEKNAQIKRWFIIREERRNAIDASVEQEVEAIEEE